MVSLSRRACTRGSSTYVDVARPPHRVPSVWLCSHCVVGCWVQVDKLEAYNKGGMAIGVVTEDFDVNTGILGAHTGSWGYSGRTGDKGDGIGGFQAYGEKFATGDTVTITLNMDAGTLSFHLNGVPQGVAFSEGLLGERLCAAVCIGGVQREGGYHAVTLR